MNDQPSSVDAKGNSNPNAPHLAEASKFAAMVQQIRDQVHRRLVRLANAPNDAEVFQSFLCRDDRLCGVRFLLKDCHALWLIDEPTIKVFRQGKLVDQFALTEPQRRAA